MLADHQAYVERSVRSARSEWNDHIVYFNVKEGWGPLCKALSLPVPEVPFPYANDADAVQEIFQDFVKRALMAWALIVAAVAVVGYACVATLRS